MFWNVMQCCDKCYSWDENSHSMYESFANLWLIQTYLYNLLFCMLSGAFRLNFPLRRYPVTVTMVVASVCAQCIDTDCQRSGDTSCESTDHWYPPSYSWPPTPPAPTQLPRVSGIWKAACRPSHNCAAQPYTGPQGAAPLQPDRALLLHNHRLCTEIMF